MIPEVNIISGKASISSVNGVGGDLALKSTYNHFHNILRLFDDLTNFPFTTSETMGDYHLYTWYIRVASRVAEHLKTTKISGKCLNFIE